MATRNIVPQNDGEGGIGTTLKRWLNGYFTNLTLVNDLTVVNGGTGKSACTAYAVQCGGTTTTGAIQDVASVGTATQVLTSNGAGALPTFQAVPALSVGKMMVTAQGYNVMTI